MEHNLSNLMMVCTLNTLGISLGEFMVYKTYHHQKDLVVVKHCLATTALQLVVTFVLHLSGF